MNIYVVLVVYLIVVNAFGFFLCGKDKKAARLSRWRTPEKFFFITSAVGGAPGVIIGMRVFRHKTKHVGFVVGIPAILIAQLVLVGYLLYRYLT